MLTPSEHWRSFFIANGFDQAQIRVNKNGIKIPENIPPNQYNGKQVRFGFVAGNEKVKGFLQIKAAFEEIASNKWELVIVDHLSHINRQTNIKIAGKGKVKIIPKFVSENANSFYDAIDVLLFPTQYPESFGLTVREALIRNKWVIASATGGVEDAVFEGVNGTLIPLSPDYTFLKKAVEQILSNPDKLNGFINPESHKIRGVSEQADELWEILHEVKSKTNPVCDRQ